jgi:hypothetical protein
MGCGGVCFDQEWDVAGCFLTKNCAGIVGCSCCNFELIVLTENGKFCVVPLLHSVIDIIRVMK